MKDIISIYTVDGVKNEVAGESGTQKLGITRSALVCEVRQDGLSVELVTDNSERLSTRLKLIN